MPETTQDNRSCGGCVFFRYARNAAGRVLPMQSGRCEWKPANDAWPMSWRKAGVEMFVGEAPPMYAMGGATCECFKDRNPIVMKADGTPGVKIRMLWDDSNHD